MTTITKKTTLLPERLVLNLDSLSVIQPAPGAHECRMHISNPAGAKGYRIQGEGGPSTLYATISINGGEPVEFGNSGDVETSEFVGIVGDLNAGDIVEVTIELDPAKAGEYRAGTLVKSALVP